MKGIVDILEQLEKLMYKILLWVILIPKTIVQITLHPDWAAGYIKEELVEGKSRFDEYMSPVVLFLICALIPSVLTNFLPRYGVDINSPAMTEPSPSRFLEFDAKANFISTSTNGYHEFTWSVQKETVDENGDTSYPVIKSTRHTSNQNDPDAYVYFNPIDANTLQDFYFEEFTDPGSYWILLDVSKFDANGNIIESYSDGQTFIYVPEDFNENLYLSTNSNNAPEKTGERKILTEQVSDQLKKESTYFLALGLLIPPLIFALAIRLFTGKMVGEDLLKDIFYIQCYYFAPISLAIWATYYAIYFTTSDVFFYNSMWILIVLLPLFLSGIWFIAVETNAIAGERQMSGRKAFLVVLLCLAIILAGGAFTFFAPNDPQIQDDIRKYAIWFYPAAAFGLLTAFGVTWFRKLRVDNKKPTTGNWVTIIAFLAVIICCILSIVFIGKNTPVAETVAEVTQNTEAPETASPEIPEASTATEPPTQELAIDTPLPEAQQFYTEGFDGNLDSWSPFMSSGIERQVNMGVENGSLVVQLSPYEDKIPWVYLINNAFTYTDVQIEVVTTNNGNNANGVSLVCQYSDSGWYEFWVSNAGLFAIYAYDPYDTTQQGYEELFSGGSSAINSGHQTNVYTAICKGNELTLYINNTPIKSIVDLIHNFTEGKIGIGVSSPQTLPVDLDFESVTVSSP